MAAYARPGARRSRNAAGAIPRGAYASGCRRDSLARMLRGTREAIVRKIQPISIHGQLSYDLQYVFADEPDSQARVARIRRGVDGDGVPPSRRPCAAGIA